MYCPKCGHQNPDDARFCMQCRADLAALLPAAVESPAASSPTPRQNSAGTTPWKRVVAAVVVLVALLGGWLLLTGAGAPHGAAVAAPTTAPAAVPNVSAFSGTNPAATSDEEAIRQMLQDQTTYLNGGNVDAYMTTIALEAGNARASTEASLRQLAPLKLRYSLEDIKVLSIQNRRAVVRVVQTTRASQPMSVPFRDNRSTFDHTLVKESGGWKVLSSVVISTQFLQNGS